MAAWNGLSGRQKVALALGVSAGAAVICVCYAKYNRERALASPGCAEDGCEIRMKIPQHAMTRLSAGGDDVISQFSKQTAARMEMSREADPEGRRDLTIRGSPAHVRQAQELLSGVLGDDALLQVELYLPARAVCRIIGQGGQRIREICKTSGAEIQCDPQPENSLGPARCITVTGSRGQVEAAKALIQRVSEEDASILKRAADSSNFRAHRKNIIAVTKKDRPPPCEESVTPETDRSPDSFHTAESPEERAAEDPEPRNNTDNTYICKFEVPSPDFNFRADEYVDVYVSAAENPEHFWIQILGSRSSQLDKLTTEMSDFYLRHKRGEMPELQVGDMVAAPFRDDRFWYRAEVLGHLEDGSVDLYYGDYGDSWACPRESLFPLRSDFLSLPFQAVECGLAGVAPSGGRWSAEALDAFDALAHCAKWRRLLAKIASFPSPGVTHFQVHLYDPNSDPMLDIGVELISRGHAVQRRMISPVKSDDETLVSRLLEEVTSLSKKPEPSTFTRQQEERQQESDESIELIRADVEVSPGLRLAKTPSPRLETSKAESLERSMSNICLGDADNSITADANSTNQSTNFSDQSANSVHSITADANSTNQSANFSDQSADSTSQSANSVHSITADANSTNQSTNFSDHSITADANSIRSSTISSDKLADSTSQSANFSDQSANSSNGSTSSFGKLVNSTDAEAPNQSTSFSDQLANSTSQSTNSGKSADSLSQATNLSDQPADSTDQSTNSSSKSVDSANADSSNDSTNFSDQSADSSGHSASADSSFSSTETGSDFSRGPASDGLSFVSSMGDGSINSPRGCFYYLTEEESAGSASSREVITISSDSEEESAACREEARRATANTDVALNSSADDVIVVEDEA
ncbi:tudor and KH domain-containing protein [Mantella aurantiaca]